MIKNIEVNGYRLLHDFQADLNQLTVVVGPNAAGKSTLLDFLMFVTQCCEHPINTVVGWHLGMFSILNAATSEKKMGWKITFQKPGGASFWNKLPLESDYDLVYEVKLDSDLKGQATVQYETLRRCEPSPGYKEAFKYLETTPLRSHIFDRQKHRLIAFDEALPEQPAVREESQEESQEKSSDNLQELPLAAKEAALRLSQMRFFNEFPIPSAVRLLFANMAFYPGFDVGSTSPLRLNPAEIRPITILFPKGENLGTVLHEILTRYDFKTAAEDIRSFFSAAYPWVEDINAETTLGGPAKVLVRLREKGIQRPIELYELSDGMLRFLCLCAALLNPLPPPLIAIDEPEAGLHPRLLPIVGDMIKTASERTQVLVTTHSPELLNQFSIDEVAVILREEAHAVWHRPGDRKTLVHMLQQVAGETLGELLKSGELEAAK